MYRGDSRHLRPGFSLPLTSLAVAAASLILVNWLAFENRLDLDHQAHATTDIIATLGSAYDHFGHAELQRATPTVVATQRRLTSTEVASFHNHSVTPPWLRTALDDLSGSWDIHYLVHYPAGSSHPWMFLNLDPVDGVSEKLVNRVRNSLTGRYQALVSGGTGSVRGRITGNVRIISETIRGSAFDDHDLAFFTWPMAGINENWMPRIARAGTSPGTMSTGLSLDGLHDLVNTASISSVEMDVAGGVTTGTSARMVFADLAVSGNGTVIDMEVEGETGVDGIQTIDDLTTRDMLGIGGLTARSSMSTLHGSIDELDSAGRLEVAGDLTVPGTNLVVDGDVRAGEGFARTIDSAMNLDLDSLVVRGFYQVDDDARVGSVTITGSGTCIGCRFSAF